MKKSNSLWLALIATTAISLSPAHAGDKSDSFKQAPQKERGPQAGDERDKSKKEAEKEESGPIAYVLFLSELRTATADSVKEWLKKGLGRASAVHKLKVSGSGSAYQVQCDGVSMKLEFAKGSWLDDHSEILRTTRDKRLREMLRRVKAHVVCEIEDTFEDDDDARSAAVDCMLHCLSGVIQPDTLAVYENDTGDFNYINDEVIASLGGENPLEAFMIEVMPPVVMVDGDSPEMKAAVAETRRRWPEFAKAFREFSLERSPFIVKARFTEGKETEYMWVEVGLISGGNIFGVLKNHPVGLKNVACDDEVRLEIARVVDWCYPDEEGEQVGGFTIDIVRKATAPGPGSEPEAPGEDK